LEAAEVIEAMELDADEAAEAPALEAEELTALSVEVADPAPEMAEERTEEAPDAAPEPKFCPRAGTATRRTMKLVSCILTGDRRWRVGEWNSSNEGLDER